jgi:hypothetical protein
MSRSRQEYQVWDKMSDNITRCMFGGSKEACELEAQRLADLFGRSLMVAPVDSRVASLWHPRRSCALNVHEGPIVRMPDEPWECQACGASL